MEIQLFTTTPVEAPQAAKDVNPEGEASAGSFEDLLASFSVADGEGAVKADANADNDAIPIDLPAAVQVTDALKVESVPSETVIESALQGVDLGIKDVKPSEDESELMETEAHEAVTVIAAPVAMPLQPVQDKTAVESLINPEVESDAVKTASRLETGDAEVTAPSNPVEGGAFEEETTAEAEEFADLSSKEGIKDAIGSIARDNGQEASGFAINHGALAGTVQASSIAAEAADTAIGAVTSEAASIDIPENAAASQAAAYVPKGTAEKEEGRADSAGETEPSEIESSGSSENRRNELDVSFNRQAGIKGGQDNGDDKGTGAERALDVKAESELSADGNDNPAFGVEFAESIDASSSSNEISVPGHSAALGAAPSLGIDRAAEVPVASENAGRVSETDTDLFEKLDTGVKMSVSGNGNVKLELSPEHLGDLEIRLTIEDAKVAAEIRVESMEIKALLDADSGRLREIFNSNGLTLERYTVEVDSGAMRGNSNGSFGAWLNDGPSGNGSGKRGWAGETLSGPAHGGIYESAGKKGGIDIFA